MTLFIKIIKAAENLCKKYTKPYALFPFGFPPRFISSIEPKTSAMPTRFCAESVSRYKTAPSSVATTGSTDAMTEAVPFSSPSIPFVYRRYGSKVTKSTMTAVTAKLPTPDVSAVKTAALSAKKKQGTSAMS